MTVGEAARVLSDADEYLHLREKKIGENLTLGEVLDELQKDETVSGEVLNEQVTIGNIVDFLKNNEALREQRDKAFTLKTTVGDVMDLLGEENVKEFVQRKTAAAGYKAEYERSESNIIKNWAMLGLFILVFALMATIVLEMIDKDKR